MFEGLRWKIKLVVGIGRVNRIGRGGWNIGINWEWWVWFVWFVGSNLLGIYVWCRWSFMFYLYDVYVYFVYFDVCGKRLFVVF